MNNKGAKTWSLRAFPAKPASADGVTTRAKAFLAEILAAEEHQFPSVGDGTDHRYRSSSPPRPICRGRDAGCPAPPSQIPAGGIPAPGSSSQLALAFARRIVPGHRESSNR